MRMTWTPTEGKALENTTFKLFMKLVTNKLNSLTDGHIPECQFGFKKERSTIQAVTALLQEVIEALLPTKGKYYAVFIYYAKDFDYINRKTLIEKQVRVNREWTHVTENNKGDTKV